MKRLAIIPARGGSKRIPYKNIREFCGLPMIAHPLGAARDSGLFSTIHVSTENEVIREVVTKFGFRPDFARPNHLADEHAPIMPVLRFTAEEYERRGQHFDEIWLIMACAPLIDPQDLRNAATMLYETDGKQAVLAVSEYPVPVEWAFSRDVNASLTPLQEGMFAVRSQDLKPSYFDSGSFVAFPANRIFESSNEGSDSGFLGYVLPKGRAIDIDDEEDWQLAEAIYRAYFARKVEED